MTSSSSVGCESFLLWSDMSGDENDVDPRVQDELEILNCAAGKINNLECELEKARSTFCGLLEDSSQRLITVYKKLGKSVNKARPYYDLLKNAKKAQADAQKAASTFQRANSLYKAARETVSLAEEKIREERLKRQTDPAWQEMLNHATMKFMDAEKEKTLSESHHMVKAAEYASSQQKLMALHKGMPKVISRTRCYFDLKDRLECHLKLERQNVADLQLGLRLAKEKYKATLNKLEVISEEIHMNRQRKLLLPPRTPGVGAESDTDSTDLPSIDLEVTSLSFPYAADLENDGDSVRIQSEQTIFKVEECDQRDRIKGEAQKISEAARESISSHPLNATSRIEKEDHVAQTPVATLTERCCSMDDSSNMPCNDLANEIKNVTSTDSKRNQMRSKENANTVCGESGDQTLCGKGGKTTRDKTTHSSKQAFPMLQDLKETNKKLSPKLMRAKRNVYSSASHSREKGQESYLHQMDSKSIDNLLPLGLPSLQPHSQNLSGSNSYEKYLLYNNSSVSFNTRFGDTPEASPSSQLQLNPNLSPQQISERTPNLDETFHSKGYEDQYLTVKDGAEERDRGDLDGKAVNTHWDTKDTSTGIGTESSFSDIINNSIGIKKMITLRRQDMDGVPVVLSNDNILPLSSKNQKSIAKSETIDKITRHQDEVKATEVTFRSELSILLETKLPPETAE